MKNIEKFPSNYVFVNVDDHLHRFKLVDDQTDYPDSEIVSRILGKLIIELPNPYNSKNSILVAPCDVKGNWWHNGNPILKKSIKKDEMPIIAENIWILYSRHYSMAQICFEHEEDYIMFKLTN